MEESVAIIVFFKVAVPSPGSVRVGKMPGGGLESFVRRKGTTRDEAVPPGRGMCMYGCPIPGNSQGVRRDEPAPYGRKDSDKIKETLEEVLKVKRDVFALQNAVGKGFGDLRFVFRCFLPLTLWPFRSPAVPGSREKTAAAVEACFRGSPETVHKIKIGAKRGKGMRMASDKGGKDTVVSEAKDPLCKGSGDQAFGNKKEEQDERADDLRLVKSGPSGVGVKRL